MEIVIIYLTSFLQWNMKEKSLHNRIGHFRIKINEESNTSILYTDFAEVSVCVRNKPKLNLSTGNLDSSSEVLLVSKIPMSSL